MKMQDVVKSNPYVSWERHCKELPNGEVFSTQEICRLLGVVSSTADSLKSMKRMQPYTTTVGRSRYWGNEKTIKKLREMEEGAAK